MTNEHEPCATDPCPACSSREAAVPKSVRLTPTVIAELQEAADAEDRSFSNLVQLAVNQLLARRQRNEHPMLDPLPDIDQRWTSIESMGMIGHTYEATLTFLLPADDQMAYDLRDALVRSCYQLGARDVVTRLISLNGMEIDTRDKCSPWCNGGHSHVDSPEGSERPVSRADKVTIEVDRDRIFVGGGMQGESVMTDPAQLPHRSHTTLADGTVVEATINVLKIEDDISGV